MATLVCLCTARTRWYVTSQRLWLDGFRRGVLFSKPHLGSRYNKRRGDRCGTVCSLSHKAEVVTCVIADVNIEHVRTKLSRSGRSALKSELRGVTGKPCRD